MHKLYEFICDELKALEKKADSGSLSMSDIQLMDTLLHSKKNLLKAEEMAEESEDYSGAMYPNSRGNYRYNDGMSYARGRRNAKRDSMGRYSSEGYSRAAEDALSSLHEMERTATDEQTKQDIRRLINRMEQM